MDRAGTRSGGSVAPLRRGLTPVRLRAVYFDVGYTLADETRLWLAVAERVGASPAEFFAMLGAVIERRHSHRRTFEPFIGGEDAALATRGLDLDLPRDLYPDAAATIAALRRRGVVVGVAGNQPARHREAFAGIADRYGSPHEWGAPKPMPGFFAALIADAGCAPGFIAYVGDRVDNDIVPARAAGLVTVFIRQGPWAVVQRSWPEAAQAHAAVDRLSELPAVLERL